MTLLEEITELKLKLAEKEREYHRKQFGTHTFTGRILSLDIVYEDVYDSPYRTYGKPNTCTVKIEVPAFDYKTLQKLVMSNHRLKFTAELDNE